MKQACGVGHHDLQGAPLACAQYLHISERVTLRLQRIWGCVCTTQDRMEVLRKPCTMTGMEVLRKPCTMTRCCTGTQRNLPSG